MHLVGSDVFLDQRVDLIGFFKHHHVSRAFKYHNGRTGGRIGCVLCRNHLVLRAPDHQNRRGVALKFQPWRFGLLALAKQRLPKCLQRLGNAITRLRVTSSGLANNCSTTVLSSRLLLAAINPSV